VDLNIQIHHSGSWHSAARVEIQNPELGVGGRALTAYELEYVLGDWNTEGLAAEKPAIDAHALSVALPLGLDPHRTDKWPAFLVDLMPQGQVRRRIAEELRAAPDDSRIDIPLLLRGAGNSIGNLRVYEAWQQEQQRAAGEIFIGLTMDDILNSADRFVEAAEKYALIATGSSGVQGEWPKLLMTRRGDDLWYPDSLVPDDDTKEHVLIKMVRGNKEVDLTILASEAPYLEVARAFGLRVGQPLRYRGGKLVIPRFDRVVTNKGLLRLGQESLASALGRAEFSPILTHEACLELIQHVTNDPATETIEYLLRDLLNLAMGNPDNHGRNTALQKFHDGTIKLSPLYDFAPMRLDEGAIARSTKWRVMEGRDFHPDWGKVAEAAAGDAIDPAKLKSILASKAPFIRDLPAIALKHGVAERVIAKALGRHEEIADSLAGLGK
jgi:serine/threonine-protein kinase HipA